jgi:hypothetical protein
MNWLAIFSNNVIMSTLAPMLDTGTCFRLSIQVSKQLAGVIFWPGKQEWEAIFQWKFRIVDMFYLPIKHRMTRDPENIELLDFFETFQHSIVANDFYKTKLQHSSISVLNEGNHLCLGGCGWWVERAGFVARRFCKYNCCITCYLANTPTEVMIEKSGGIVQVQRAHGYHVQKVIEQVKSSVFGVAVNSLSEDAQQRFLVFLNRQTEGNRFMSFYEAGQFSMFSKYKGTGFIDKETTMSSPSKHADFVFFSSKYIEGCIEYSVQKILWLLKTDFCKIVFNTAREDPPQLDEILGVKRRKLN